MLPTAQSKPQQFCNLPDVGESVQPMQACQNRLQAIFRESAPATRKEFSIQLLSAGRTIWIATSAISLAVQRAAVAKPNVNNALSESRGIFPQSGINTHSDAREQILNPGILDA